MGGGKLDQNSTQIILEKVTQWFEAYNGQDCDLFSSLFSENGAILECGGIDSAVGREKIAKVCEYESLWKRVSLVPSNIFADEQNGQYQAFAVVSLTGQLLFRLSM